MKKRKKGKKEKRKRKISVLELPVTRICDHECQSQRVSQRCAVLCCRFHSSSSLSATAVGIQGVCAYGARHHLPINCEYVDR